jgi:hypothetical protein
MIFTRMLFLKNKFLLTAIIVPIQAQLFLGDISCGYARGVVRGRAAGDKFCHLKVLKIVSFCSFSRFGFC